MDSNKFVGDEPMTNLTYPNNNDSTSKDQYSSFDNNSLDKIIKANLTYKFNDDADRSVLTSTPTLPNSLIDKPDPANNISNTETSLKDTRKRKLSEDASGHHESKDELQSSKKQKTIHDEYCWKCHFNSVDKNCSLCERSWHDKCYPELEGFENNSQCPACSSIMKAENVDTRSPQMARVTVKNLCKALKHVIDKMKTCPDSKPFWTPVNLEIVTDYKDKIVKPMDLSLLESKVTDNEYCSIEAFKADAEWIRHNCYVYNSNKSHLTTIANKLLIEAEWELSDMESCFECYYRFHILHRQNWFVEVCNPPHTLVWAKLSGYPYWPAKVFPRTDIKGSVFVKFFGDQTYASLNATNVFLLSEKPPPSSRKSDSELLKAKRDMVSHCNKLKSVFGEFKFAETEIKYNPKDPRQINILLPEYNPSQFYDPIKFFQSRDNQISSDENSISIEKNVSNAVPIHVEEKVRTKRKYVRKIKKPVVVVVEDTDEIDDDDFTLTVSPADSEKKVVKKRAKRKLKLEKNINELQLNSGIQTPIDSSAPNSGRSTPRKRNSIAKLKTSNGSVKTKTRRSKSKPNPKSIDTTDIESSPEKLISAGNEGQIEKVSMRRLSRRLSGLSDYSRPGTPIFYDETNDQINERILTPSPFPKKQMRAKKSFPNKPPPVPPTPQRPLTPLQPVQQHVEVSPPRYKTDNELCPPEAGPLHKDLHDTTEKITNLVMHFLKSSVESCVDGNKVGIYIGNMQIEKLNWEHRQRLNELERRHGHEMSEMRSTMEAEKLRTLKESMKRAEEEKHSYGLHIKTKYWCTYCNQEASYICCWKTAYCNETCQKRHWSTHKKECKTRITILDNNGMPKLPYEEV